MTDIKPLEILYKENGLVKSPDEPLLIGEYDIEKGLLFKFYMRNSNEEIRADISKIKSLNDDWTFVGPNFINPGETVQVLIRIQSIDNIEKLGVEPLKSKDFPSDFGKLTGTVRWERASNPVISQ